MNEKLSPASITTGLNTVVIGRRVIYYPRLESTMEAARQAVINGAEEGTVIIADEQTAGRGRMGRQWLSPEGSVALSVVLYPQLASVPFLVMMASLAVVHSIESVAGLKPEIKWPNDVLIKGKKVCGILTEISIKGDSVKYAVIGTGINVNTEAETLVKAGRPATALALEVGRDVSRLELIQALLTETEKLYVLLPEESNIIFTEWRNRLVTLGKRINVTSDTETCQGFAETVTTEGSLVLRLDDGSLKVFTAGDVTLRNP